MLVVERAMELDMLGEGMDVIGVMVFDMAGFASC